MHFKFTNIASLYFISWRNVLNKNTMTLLWTQIFINQQIIITLKLMNCQWMLFDSNSGMKLWADMVINSWHPINTKRKYCNYNERQIGQIDARENINCFLLKLKSELSRWSGYHLEGTDESRWVSLKIGCVIDLRTLILLNALQSWKTGNLLLDAAPRYF